jgi:poly-gamma-glutamate capsule biosynthesis protein CapA/YwtB (metallophosphatase superfamily)
MHIRRAILLIGIFIFFHGMIARAESITTKITLSFVGDCTLGSTDSTRDAAYSFSSYIAANGYDYPFLKTKEILANDDLTIANLEGCLYDVDLNRAQKTYAFRGSTDFAQILTRGGIDVVNIANNHTIDYGKQGIEQTMKALDAVHVGYFGATEYTAETYVYHKDGINIGFLGSSITYWWKNPEAVKNCFAELKARKCEVIIASMHGGVEYDVLHDSLLEKMANTFISLGADIVIGHHPHTIQGIDISGGKTVIYSLGNFCFGGNSVVRTIDTFIAQITLLFKNGHYMGHQLNIIPAMVSGTSPDNNYQPVIATGADATRIIASIQKDSNFVLNPYKEGTGAVQEFIPFIPVEQP